MKWLLAGGLGLVAVVVIVAVVLFGVGVGMYNDAAKLKNQYDAKLMANHAELDNVKKKIGQVAEVTDEQMKSLERLFTGYATARTSKSENQLMTWIKETVPNVDQKTFLNLQNIITSSRDAWTMRQTELVDVAREYNQRLVTFPSNFILKFLGFEKIVPNVVTSTSTEKAFETGKDDETKVFNK